MKKITAETLTDEEIREEATLCHSERRFAAEDECEVALDLHGRWPDGLYDHRIGRRFTAFEARERVASAINARNARKAGAK